MIRSWTRDVQNCSTNWAIERVATPYNVIVKVDDRKIDFRLRQNYLKTKRESGYTYTLLRPFLDSTQTLLRLYLDSTERLRERM